LKESGIPREEIFLTTKVWIEHYGYENAKASVLESIGNSYFQPAGAVEGIC
jgi:2,5-diketo-D-gluconate reductase A